MQAARQPELPSPRDYDEYGAYKYKSFLFSHCKYRHYKDGGVRDYHAYCSGHFVNKRGVGVYCECECHQPPERD